VSNEPEVYDCCDFPNVKQFFLVERVIERNKRGDVTQSVDVAYGVTSLNPEKASPQRLLELNRRHWEIENRIHWVRDVTYDEDRCRIRTHNGPRVMATIRNIAIAIVRMMGFRYIPDAHRAFTFCERRSDVMGGWGI
jgi:hypothetical protein